MSALITRSLTGFIVVLAAVSSVRAADTAPGGEGLAEVIVTAQKRAESEQTVPLSMTIFGAAALEQRAITTFFDYGTKVPNLAFAMTGDGVGTSRTISIRGISGDNVTGFYVDETPLPDSIDPRVLDVDHIEVLRGPQGTLYGARSMGGTIRIITKTPELSKFSADLHAGAGSTWNTDRPNYTGDAVVNIPVVEDRMALRISGFYDYEAGYLKRRYCTDPNTTAFNLNALPTCTPLTTDPALTTTVDNVADLKTYGGAAALTIKVADNLTITPRVMLQRTTYNGLPMSDVLTTPENGYGYPVPSGPTTLPTLKPTDFVQARNFNIPEGGSDRWNLYSLALRWNVGIGEIVSSTGYFDRKVIETEDETDFVFAALLGGFQALRSSITEEKNYQRFVQEVRFASQLPGPLQFVVGGFFSDFHGRLPFAAAYPSALAPGYGDILTNVFGSCVPPPAPAGTYLCPNPNNPDQIFGSDYRTEIKEPAVFGEISYELTPQFKATVGLRWSQVKTTAGGYEEGTVTQSNTDYYSVPPIGRVVDPDVTTKENSTTPKVQLDYKLTPSAMIYTMIAKGFRPGGLVPSVPAALCSGQLPEGVTVDQTRSFKSDSLWNYELGTKTGWFDNKLTFNAAGFYIRWKNIQQNILLGCGFQYRANAGAAESKGGEAELHARPIEPLELSLGLGYQNAKITEAGALSPQRPGDPVFQVPDWTGNASVSWTQPLASDWKLNGTADFSYVGRSFSANNLAPDQNGVFLTRERPSYNLLDLRIALARFPYEVAVVAKNVTNEHANLGDSRSIAAETPGRPRLLLNQPRTVGVEVRASF
jgi:outer membrane receptor protein involved in Fe transport